jgi:aminopeptidase Y
MTTVQPSQSTPMTTAQPSQNSTLVGSINIEEILGYLRELQNIANRWNGTRAINTPGFNGTLDYITATIKANTDFVVIPSFFPVRDFALDGDPILTSSTNNVTKTYTYSSNPTSADFLHVKYGTSSNITNVFQLTVIPNGGCTETDWNSASQPTVNRIALVKRGGSCAFADRAAQAAKFNVSGILFYNDGELPDRMSPIEVSLGQDNALPALFLSFPAGQALADAVLNTSINVTVQLGINLQNLPNFPVGNICADTTTGNATQTIVIGGHSDSVPAGPGINDNGKL